MKGRKPLPTKLHMLHGNPSKVDLDMRLSTEAQPEEFLEIPSPPAHLNKDAKKAWRILAPQLKSCGLLSKIDLPAFGLLCNEYGLWISTSRQIEKTGLLMKSADGSPAQNPLMPICNKAFEKVYKLLSEFGMTPTSRVRTVVGASGEKKSPLQLYAESRRSANGKKV